MAVWRRLRAAGAARVQTSVWALPRSDEHEALLRELLGEIAPQGGGGLVLEASALDGEVEAAMVARFRRDRDEEYAEIVERCGQFLGELAKETRQGKFTFAELEENELEFAKLEAWLGTVQERDLFVGARAVEAEDALRSCREALASFAGWVADAEVAGAGVGGGGGGEGASSEREAGTDEDRGGA